MSIICVDGIPGAGKTTIIMGLLKTAANRGVKTQRLHFFSDLPKLVKSGSTSPFALESALLKGDLALSERQQVFHELCTVASDALLKLKPQLSCDLLIVDRSPLTLFAYSRAVFRRPSPLKAQFRAALQMLQPIVVLCDPGEAYARVRARDQGNPKGFLHALSAHETEQLQGAYVNAASEYGFRTIGGNNSGDNYLEADLLSLTDANGNSNRPGR